MKPTHLASLRPNRTRPRRYPDGAADRRHQEEIIHDVVVHFSQEQLLQIPLTETEDQGEAGQDEQGEDHDPGHPVVFVVAVSVIIMPVPVGSSSTGVICPGPYCRPRATWGGA